MFKKFILILKLMKCIQMMNINMQKFTREIQDIYLNSWLANTSSLYINSII